jgi:hypothetical protein
MPFEVVKSNSRRRFTEVLINLSYIESIEPRNLQVETPIQVKILRGMYYVHLYAALERTINEVVEQALIFINSKNVPNKHYATSFNTISLNSQMQAFKAIGYKGYITKSIEVFSAIEANESFVITNTLLSTSLQNIWHETIQQTLACFGITAINFSPRVRLTIDEIVEKRNAVAHGRETPTTIGERYRSNVLRQKTQEIQQVVDLVVSAFETFIFDRKFVKVEYFDLYA